MKSTLFLQNMSIKKREEFLNSLNIIDQLSSPDITIYNLHRGICLIHYYQDISNSFWTEHCSADVLQSLAEISVAEDEI